MAKRESPLFSNSLLALFAAIVLAALYFAFPGQRLLTGFKSKPVDIASLAYVRAAFNREPDNDEYRVQLAEKLFEISQIKEAETILAPLLLKPNPDIKVQTLSINIRFRAYFDAPDTLQKTALQQQLHNEIKRLFPQLANVAELDELADVATQLGEPLLAADIYRYIINLQSPALQKAPPLPAWLGISVAHAETSPQTTQYYIDKHLQALLAGNAGAEALQWAERYVQQYPQDSAILRRAIAIAQSQNDAIHARDWGRLLLATQPTLSMPQSMPPCQVNGQARQLQWECASKASNDSKIILKSVGYMNLLKQFDFSKTALEQQYQRELAANQLDNSVRWYQQLIATHQNAKDFLPFAVAIAQKQGASALAQQWHAKLLALQPQNIQLLQEQIAFEMAVPNLPQALELSQQWQRLSPTEAKAHLQTANLAQWTGNADMALDEWLWLYHHVDQATYLPNIISLATARYKFEPVVNLLAQLGQQRPLNTDEMATWLEAIQKSGLQDAGSGILQAYAMRYPKDEKAWQALVTALEQSDRSDLAIGTLQTMERQFQPTVERRLKQVALMMKLGQIQDAWQVLQKSKSLVKANDRTFWNEYAKAAFLVGDEQALLGAYKDHALVNEKNATLNYYVLNAAREKADGADFEHYALKIWQKSHDEAVLFDLIQFKIQQAQWEKANSLLALADTRNKAVFNSGRYWLMRAEIAGHFNDKATVNQALRQALALDANAVDARSLLIWHLVAAGEKNQLHQLLDESTPLAQTQPKLWEAMAVGRRFLGQPKAALPWYAKALKQWPEREALMLEYVQLLQEAGEVDSAKKIGRYLLNKMTANGLVTAQAATPGQTFAVERRYGEMLRLHLGAHASEQWLRWMQQHQDGTHSDFSEYRIAWFLAQHRYAEAQTLTAKVEQSGQRLPAWQRLAVATANQDVKTIAHIMQKPEQLTPLDRVNALRTLGEDQQALTLATTLLGTAQSEEVTAALRRQVADLSALYPNGWAVGAKMHNISELDILSYGADAAISKNQHSIEVNVKDQFLSSSQDRLRLQADQRHEQLLNVRWKYRNHDLETRLKAGASLRGDSDLFSVDGGVDYHLMPGWKVQLEAGYNQLSTESALFRLAGLKDQLELRLSGELSKREYFSVYAQGKHFKTRGGDSVGFGVGSGAEIGYRLWLEKPEWVVALYGNWNQANLDNALPEEWQRLGTENLTMNNVLSPSYKEIGLDIRLREGDLKPFGYTSRSLRYFLEGGLFLGQPTGQLGTKVAAGLGTRLFTDDEISLSGLYSSVQGGAQSMPSTSVELRYSKRF